MICTTKSGWLKNTSLWAILALSISLPYGSQAQRGSRGPSNYEHFARKWYYFGITLGFNQSYYRITHHTSLIMNDSLNVIQSMRGPGFNLGIVTNLNFNKNFDVRFLLPTLSFADRRLVYDMRNGETQRKKIESVFLEFPIQFRYKSKPYKDTRIFVTLGCKYSYDLASNSRTRQAADLVRVLPHDFVVEAGLGFQIFFPYFILSPEIKFSHGTNNLLQRNPDLLYSAPLKGLFSRGFAISFHFEG